MNFLKYLTIKSKDLLEIASNSFYKDSTIMPINNVNKFKMIRIRI